MPALRGCLRIIFHFLFTGVSFSDFLGNGAGLIEEYDSPAKLLEDKSSSFAQLVAEYTMRASSSFEKSVEH